MIVRLTRLETAAVVFLLCLACYATIKHGGISLLPPVYSSTKDEGNLTFTISAGATQHEKLLTHVTSPSSDWTEWPGPLRHIHCPYGTTPAFLWSRTTLSLTGEPPDYRHKEIADIDECSRLTWRSNVTLDDLKLVIKYHIINMNMMMAYQKAQQDAVMQLLENRQ